jgi:hypothetical protein
MQCKAFLDDKQCSREAADGWPCCDKECGYYFSKDTGKLRKVLIDETIKWDEVPWGIKNWSVAKYLYYFATI